MQSSVPTIQPLYMTIDEFALRVGVCKNTVKKWVAANLPHFRAGRTVRIHVEKAELWLLSGGGDGTRKNTRTKRNGSASRVTAPASPAGEKNSASQVLETK